MTFFHHFPSCSRAWLWVLAASFPLLVQVQTTSYAQVPAPITSSGLNTQVSGPINLPSGQVQYNITGGTRPGNGSNLFHSFGEFGVPTNNIGNFLNDSGLATSNILGRVTGGNPSSIFGTIQTTGFGNANLFLMNPAGIVFGPTAQLNVGGAVNFTTANYLRLAEQAGGNAGIFYANPLQTSVLTSAPVVAFGFLTPTPAPITVRGASLSVPQGQSISLVGGDISVQSGALDGGPPQAAKLSAPGGQINIASVASAGEVLYPSFNFGPNVNGDSFGALGSITLSQGTALDVSADAAGSVVIRGGQLTIADATISANTGDTNGALPAVDIKITGDLTLSDTRGAPSISATTTGLGDAGEVSITSGSVTASSTVQGLFSAIDTHTSGTGRAGNVSITTGTLAVTGPDTNLYTFIDSGTAGPGHGGNVNIAAQNIELIWTTLSTGQLVGVLDLFFKGLDFTTVSGSAGNLSMTASNVRLQDSILDTSASAAFPAPQQGGDITITATNVNMINSSISLAGTTRGGAVTINADSVATDATVIDTETGAGPGPSGDITVNARAVEFTNGSSFISATSGDGKGGDITVTATDHITLLGVTGDNPQGLFRPSGIFSNSFGAGDAGNVILTTPRLDMNQGRINTSTASSGRGGNVIINAGSITMSGEFPNPDFTPEPIFTITDIHPSGVFTKTVGGACAAVCGDAGQISITTGALTMGNGSQIDSGTSTNGRGGDISIHATDIISLSGTLSNGQPVGIFSRTIGTDPGSGNAGTILVQAPHIDLSNQAAISASTSGSGNAGNITVKSSSLNISSGAQLTSSSVPGDSGVAPSGSAGTVTIEGLASPADSVAIQGPGSGIFTDTQGTGTGGDINISAKSLTVQDSATLSATTFGTAPSASGGTITIAADQTRFDTGAFITTSTQGPGQAGNINITADSFGMFGGSVISADTGFGTTGRGGNILISARTVEVKDFSTLTTLTLGDGAAGNITVRASESLLFADAFINTDSFSFDPAAPSTGAGGEILLSAPTMDLRSSLLSTSSGSAGDAGHIVLETQNMTLRSSEGGNLQGQGTDVFALTQGPGHGGTITVRGLQGEGNSAQTVVLTDSARVIARTSATGEAGSININSSTVTVDGHSQLNASTLGEGPGGSILINGQTVTLQNGGTLSAGTSGATPTATGGMITVTANSFQVTSNGLVTSETTGPGNAGNIAITAGTASLSSGGQLRANTSGDGLGGGVSITTTGGLSLSGSGTGVSSTASSAGHGGAITIQSGTLTISDNATISAASTGTGNAGTVNIQTTGNFVMNGGTVSTSATQGLGGNITVNAGQQVQMNSGALISASSTGPGNAGDILMAAGDSIFLSASKISTEATQALGGNITLTAPNFVQLDNSIISSSVGPGVGGNITIDPQFVILENNSQIIAQAVQGQGGNINITTEVLLVDGTSVIDASSQFGVNGTVNIQSPISNLSQVLNPLQRSTLQAAALLRERCAVRAQSGGLSSLTVRSRDIAPAAPGGMLSGALIPIGPSPAASGASPSVIQQSEVTKPALLEVSAELLRPIGGKMTGSLGGCGL